MQVCSYRNGGCEKYSVNPVPHNSKFVQPWRMKTFENIRGGGGKIEIDNVTLVNSIFSFPKKQPA